MLDKWAIMTLFSAAVAGALLGALYFSGLWWTVRCMPRSRRPFSLYFGSLLLRVAMLLCAFYGVLVGLDWPPLMACLAGFIVARAAATHWLGDADDTDTSAQRAT